MDAREIQICDQDGTDQHKDIYICNQDGDEKNRDIQICTRDGEISCVEPLPLLELSGADELESTTDYEQYTASGGVLPYSYSFDGGSINSSGLITSITSCGGSSGNGAVGSITVTDACGQTKSITVRLPGGQWVEQSVESGGDVYGSICISVSDACGSDTVCLTDFGYSNISPGYSQYHQTRYTYTGHIKIIDQATIKTSIAQSTGRHSNSGCVRGGDIIYDLSSYLDVENIFTMTRYAPAINGCPSLCLDYTYGVCIFKKYTYFWECI